MSGKQEPRGKRPDPPPPRLEVIPASEAKVAVILRRGPSRRVACLFWNRETDEVLLGQWFKGRIHADCSDVSPDGRHFIYSADDYRRSKRPGTAERWTAISHPPYLTAIVLHDERHGFTFGGYFLDNRRFWVNSYDQDVDVRASGLECVRYLQEGGGSVGGGDVSIQFLRLLRQGWRLEETAPPETDPRKRVARHFLRTLPGGWLLRKRLRDWSHTVDSEPGLEPHELRSPNGDYSIQCSDWDWADWLDDRLVWCTRGGLWTAEFNSSTGLGEPRLLHNFCGMKFRERIAPYEGIKLRAKSRRV